MLGLYWHIDRWRQSAAYVEMTAEEQGVYRNLLDEATLRDGSLPTDEALLARVACGGDRRVWKRCREAVLRRFELMDGVFVNRVLDKVLTTSQKRIDKQQRYRDRIAAERNAPGNAPGNGSGNAPGNGRRYQDQDQDTRQERTQGREAVPDPRASARLAGRPEHVIQHDGHADGFCAWVCLPEVFITERLSQVRATRAEFLAWANATMHVFRDVPVDASKPFDFWRARLAEATNVVTATPDEAKRYQDYLRAVCNAPGRPLDLTGFVLRLRRGPDAGPIAPPFLNFLDRKDRTA